MNTKMIRITEEDSDYSRLQEAGEILRAGGLVAFPTETVYGLGGDALNPESSRKIYAAKGRPSDNPLIVHIADMDALSAIVEEVPEEAARLAEIFWPGPLTMIFKKSPLVPEETTGGLDTVAVRMPVHRVAREFIRRAGGYVAAPSANLSGRPSPTLAKYVAEDMDGRIEMIIDGGGVQIGLESTIVDMTSEKPMILRPGFITREMLEEVLEEVQEDVTLMSADSGQAPKAPGMKYRHYAPKGDLTIVKGSRKAVTEYINKETKRWTEAGRRVGVIGTDETIGDYLASVRKSAGTRTEDGTIGRELYRILREFDEEETEIIYSESFRTEGFGQAIMNRLLKAAGHKVVDLEKEDII